ncbi:MAG: cytidine deaminase [Acetobacteraceae bacterium]|nr:cytidine deaminase [Acetobacteraceae bacterium]
MSAEGGIDRQRLLALARQARESAYAPYSGYPVGAALLARDGTVYAGCNLECASYGLTLCAERVALGAAVSAGRREFLAIAVVAAGPVPPSPCGACRQLLAEFGEGTLVIASNLEGHLWEAAVGQLLPACFRFPAPRRGAGG